MLKNYFKEIEEKARIIYSIAEEARKKGLDPSIKVEIPLTKDLAERATGIVSIIHPQIKDKKIEERIKELEKTYGFLELAVALKIAEEIAKQKYCRFSNWLEAMEAGIRLGIAYLTLGIVSSPIEGFIKLEIKKTQEGKDYLTAFFAGPIRSAGGTVAALSLIIIDYLRKIFGFAKYDPTKEEIKRAITEIYDYHERVTNLQYLPSEKEIEIIVNNLPIQIDGEASEEKEVSNYKDLPRVSTNKIRSGFCLVLAEGISLKAMKLVKKIKKLKEQGIDLEADWKWLENLRKEESKQENKIEPSYTYIKDIVAGRPIFAHPSTKGGFRLRYGRTRTSGYSAMAVNPATMYLLEDFLAIGTQLRTERPGKSCSLATCDSIEGPIVKLEDGSVLKINQVERAIKYRDKVKKIIYIGDLLISYGDFFNRNHLLIPIGYVEEWWWSELKEKLEEIIKESKKIEEVNRAQELLDKFGDYRYFNLDLKEAIEISIDYKVPFYPKFIFYWSQINGEQLREILNWLNQSRFNENFDLVLPYFRSEREKLKIAKEALELIGLEHLVANDWVVIKQKKALTFLLNLGLLGSEVVLKIFQSKIQPQEINKEINKEFKEKLKQKLEEFKEIKEIKEPNSKFNFNLFDWINKNSEFKIRDKTGSFIGARMGRPEKAKPKVMTGQPNCLFPVGDEGGRLRSFNSALEKGWINAEFPTYWCNRCNKETIYKFCENCKNETEKKYWCEQCNKLYTINRCKLHGSLKSYRKKKIDIKHFFNKAIELLNLNKNELPELVKGVRGTNSLEHIPEHLAKGILRAIYKLPVNKDGTIRYDATELPITHFKPREIGTSIEKLKELGYTKDIKGKPLTNEDQILALMPQDIILPACKESLDEPADKFFLRVANFIDVLLVRFYKLKPFYEAKTREDLIGHLVLCIAPHNAAGTVARIIGFSNTQTFLASPFLHAALRRDCDGDEAAFMLLLDALLNFSLQYLPAHRGGTQDCPVILNVKIKPNEVDDMVFDIEAVDLFPTYFYEAANQFKNPSEVKIKQVKSNIESNEAFFIPFTHPTNQIDLGNKCSAYKKLATMQEKVQKQMEVGEKIRAVNTSDLAKLIITRHFMRDIRGNLRKFSMQQFRCVQCNEKYRRPPLKGLCLKCNGRIIFTIAEGTIKKYLEPAIQLAEKYEVPTYIKQSLELTKASIDAIFGKSEEKQEKLEKWF